MFTLLFAMTLAVTPLPQAHAHNDYEHKRPLADALDCGFCSVEADVFLVNGKLLVAHNAIDLKPERTLEALYLDPLRARARANGGKVYPNGPSFHLLIDIKTEAKVTCTALNEVLARYADILSVVENDKLEAKAVSVIVSGSSSREVTLAPAKRFAGIDGRPVDLPSDVPAHRVPWISDRWGAQFKWNGDGPMPAEEQSKLRVFVAKAHARGRKVRFWGTPEKLAVWKELRAAGVDLINTDKLTELRDFLLTPVPGTAP